MVTKSKGVPIGGGCDRGGDCRAGRGAANPQIDFKSVGRGAPVMVDAATLPVIGATYQGGPGGGGETKRTRHPRGRSSVWPSPAKRRRASNRCRATCLRPTTSTRTRRFGPIRAISAATRRVAIEDMWTQRGAIGKNGPTSAGWGRCDSDYPREAIVSPYPFKTAQEHYEALKAETTKRGGPTKHTYATVPGDEWTGRYGRASTESWYQARKMQVPTMLSLLTPKYQQYLVQEAYHRATRTSRIGSRSTAGPRASCAAGTRPRFATTTSR